MGVFLWEIFQCMYCRRHLHCRDKLVWTLKVIFITVLLGRVSEDWRNVLNDKCVNAVGLESQRKKFSAQLELLQRKGVALFVDGAAALPDEAAAKAVQEDSPYMADYVLGTAGNIEQIRFDRVTDR